MTTQLELFARALPTVTERVIDWESLSGCDIAALDVATHKRFCREHLQPAERRLRWSIELKRARAYRRANPLPPPEPVCGICGTQYGGRECDRCG